MTSTTSRPAPLVPIGSGRLASSDGIGDFLRSLRSYWWLVLLCIAGVAGATAAWTVREAPIYEANCTIEFDPNPPRPLGRDIDDVASPLSNFWLSREFFATQERVLNSRAIAERVVTRLGLHHDRSFVGGELPPDWAGIPVERAAGILQSRVIVDDIQGTRLVQIKVRDTERERAALIANTIAEVYIEKTLEDRLGSTVSALEWLGEQLDSLRGELDESEMALHAFKLEHNILSVSLEDRQNLVAQEIEHFSTALTDARTERIARQARLSRLRALLGAEDVEEQASTLVDVATIQTLRTQLREKLAEVDGLEQRYGPGHPRMQQLTAEIAALREQLRSEIEGLVRAAEADVREANATETGLRSALEQAHAAGLELNVREIEYSRLSRERDNNEKLYEVVLQRTTEADITRMLRTTFVRMVDRALPPTGAIGPRISFNTSVAALAGLALGLLVAFALGRMDTRLRSAEELEEMGATILGVLPKMDDADAAQSPQAKQRQTGRRRGAAPPEATARDLIAHDQPLSAVAENFRTIRTNLVFMGGDEKLQVLVITSANPREGKTTIAANLATSLAQSGKRVLVIDTDLRRPRLHRAFRLRNGVGVTTYVAGQATLDEVLHATVVPGVHIIPSGPIPPNPTELLHREKFHELIRHARDRFDVILCDSPPLGAVIDAAVLAPQVDGVVLVARPGETTRQALRTMLRQLRDVGARVVGAIVNGVDPRGRGGYGAGSSYYYYYRRDRYYTSDPEPADDREPRDEDRDPPSAGADA